MCQLQNKECCLSCPQSISVPMCEGCECLALFFSPFLEIEGFPTKQTSHLKQITLCFIIENIKKTKKQPTCTKPFTLMFTQVIKGILPLTLNHTFILTVQSKTTAKALEVISQGAKMRNNARVRGIARDVDTC